MSGSRLEKDSFGTIEVPAERASSQLASAATSEPK